MDKSVNTDQFQSDNCNDNENGCYYPDRFCFSHFIHSFSHIPSSNDRFTGSSNSSPYTSRLVVGTLLSTSSNVN